ncbi:YwqI/YxiC family protein [Oceanobacillus sp. CFH 90083]|uniref:YwqI/YxiC family protein n=1 Tax=Oceanobacillus sp. CFH 90083 TaxID=2592336 RepID=UPI00128DFD2D|nr:YwqI/YxiC family protein [Oceanobacillus sp. CFH 90083]
MTEIKLNRGPVEQKFQDYEHVLAQVKAKGLVDIRGKNNLDAVKKMNQLNQRIEQLTVLFQHVSAKHITSALRALDTLEEKERMAAQGIKMIKS